MNQDHKLAPETLAICFPCFRFDFKILFSIIIMKSNFLFRLLIEKKGMLKGEAPKINVK